MHVRTFGILFLFTAGGLAGAATAQVSPADRATREGDSSTIYPLGRFNARVQTLHADLPANTLLRGHAYRRDAAALRGQVPAFRTELQVTPIAIWSSSKILRVSLITLVSSSL